MHSWWKTQDFSKIESGPNYTTAAHAFVKATLRLGLRAPFVARNNNYRFALSLRYTINWCTNPIITAFCTRVVRVTQQNFFIDFAVVFYFMIARSEMKFHARPTWDA